MDYDSLKDEELVEVSQAGDTAAGDVLLRRFKGLVSIIARPYFIMGGDREDIVQEGMIGLYKAMREYRLGFPGTVPKGVGQSPSVPFAAFAASCIKNQILDAIKNASRKKHSPLNQSIPMDAEALEIMDELQDPEKILIHRENIIHLEAAVKSSLSALESSILSHFLQGKSYAQIAKEKGISVKAVDNALYRIRRKVQK